jgi:hypothetical protein
MVKLVKLLFMTPWMFDAAMPTLPLVGTPARRPVNGPS